MSAVKMKTIGKCDSLSGLRLKPSTGSSVVALAISANKNSKYVIKWALQNLVPEQDPGKFCFKLLHVFPRITSVPSPMGGTSPVLQVRNDIVAAYRKEVEWKITEKLLPYKILCLRKNVQVEVVQIESDDIAYILAEQIGKYNIDKLVIGSASTRRMFSKKQNLSARISECCPSFCTVFVISKDILSSVRPSDPIATLRNREKTSNSNRFNECYPKQSFKSLPEWIAQGSNASLPPPPRSPPAVELGRFLNIETREKTLADFIEDDDSDVNSCSGNSDINDAKSRASSSRSLVSDDHSWTTTYRSSSMDASTDSSWGSQVDINYELEELRMELRHITGMYAKAQTGAKDASQLLNDLHRQQLEEMIKLTEISIKEEEAKELAELEKARYEATKVEAEDKVENSLINPVHQFQEFSWEEIMAGTSSFSDEFKVGIGSYGTVYKCNLHHTTAAVKILHSVEDNWTKQFQQELEILGNVRHPNLVTLLGACPDHGCLAYEYMDNGSLEDKLSRQNGTTAIPWFDRFRIAHQIASALTFLHNTKPKPIIHGGLKPANILLDHKFFSKVGDAGLSTMLKSDTFGNTTTTLYNGTSPGRTFSYMDPEYQRTGLISPKSDVYAFGMVVMQLLTAKPALGLAHTLEMAIEDDKLEGLLDREAGEWPIQSTKELAFLALRCTELHSRDRPDLKIQILPALEKLTSIADKARELASSSSTSCPNHFLCPIRKVVMNDPCVAADGYTYDREAIEEWLERNGTSPVTKLPLLNESLIPNYALFSAIKEWKAGKI